MFEIWGGAEALVYIGHFIDTYNVEYVDGLYEV